MKEAVAFSPGHITGLFQICDQTADPLLKGSRGSGISITRGVTTRVRIEKARKTSCVIEINNEIVRTAKVSKHVVDGFLSNIKENYQVLVNHEVEVPIGSGLGSSGAGALSLALALNEALDIGLSRIKAAQLAHIAEVECKTGLGTVIAETHGGLEIRVKPGAPGVGKIVQIPVRGDYVVVYLTFGPMSTARILTNKERRGQINKFGGELVDELSLCPNPQTFMALSRSFAERIGLISMRMREVLRDMDDGEVLCSMAMFGDVLFSLVERDNIGRVLKIFRRYAPSKQDITAAEIDFQGARLL